MTPDDTSPPRLSPNARRPAPAGRPAATPAAAMSVLVTGKAFAAMLSMGKSTFDRMRAGGLIGPEPIRLGGLKWHRDEVIAWLAARRPDGMLPDRKAWTRLRAIEAERGAL